MIVSEIRYNQTDRKLRFDAEYYQPEFLETDNALKRVKPVSLKEIAEFSKLRRNPANNPEAEFKYIDISNINTFTGEANVQRLKGCQAPSRARKVVRKNDLILSTVRPNRNAVAIIPKEFDNEICSTGFAVVKAKNINPYFLFAFFKTKYAINQLIRQTMSSMYPAVSEEDIGSIHVPLPPQSFQEKIESLVREAHKKRDEANKKYKEAEQLLNKTLGIESLEIREDRIFKTSFSEIKQTMRFDSEYYQPNYQQVKDILSKCSYKVRKLKEVVEISFKEVDPTKEPTKKFKYIELANINPSTGEIEGYSEIKGYNAPSRARMIVKKGDILVASLLGSLDNIALVPAELDNAIASTGFFVISSDIFSSEFLLLLFKSDLIKTQLKQKTSGAIMSAIPKTTCGSILIPVIPMEKQRGIANLAKESFNLRKNAKQLLSKAKQEVENFIERGI